MQIIDELAVQLPTRVSIPQDIQEQGEQYHSNKSDQLSKIEIANNLRISKQTTNDPSFADDDAIVPDELANLGMTQKRKRMRSKSPTQSMPKNVNPTIDLSKIVKKVNKSNHN